MEQLLIPYQATEGIPAQAVVVFAPHPDDEIFGCGGALARHAAAGVPVHTIIVTDGAFSASAGECQDIVATREAESLAAAAALGIPPPVFWRMPDRGLQYGEVLIERLVEAVRQHGADLVYAPSLHEAHPDHRVLAMAAVEAVRRIGSAVRLAMYEIGVPLRPNVLVDITQQLERKRTAMRCFASQLALQRYDEQIEALNRYRAYTLPKQISAAEAFELVSSEDLALKHLSIFASEYQHQKLLGLPMDGGVDLPLVSIMIRSMNRPTLVEALNSIALQTYPNIEVIVINACGTSHQAIGDSCGSFPLRFVDSRERLARSQAANLGLEKSRGDFLIFLDDDDLFLPAHISRLASALKQNHDKIAAYSEIACIDSSGNHIRKFAYPFDKTRLLAENYIPIHAVMFRRMAVEHGCRMDESFDLYEDWEFWLQVSELGDFIFIDHLGALYRIGEESGAGIRPDKTVANQVRSRLFKKWRERWRQDDLDRLMTRFCEYRNSEVHYRELCVQHNDLAEKYSHQAALNAALSSENSDLRDEQKKLVSDLHAIMDERETLFRSTSWRLTQPLRSFTSLIRQIVKLVK